MSRSKWKGPSIKASSNFKYFEKTIILPRNFEITSKIINQNFNVHTGKKFLKISITNDMVGHKIGEFVPTRETFIFKKKKKKK